MFTVDVKQQYNNYNYQYTPADYILLWVVTSFTASLALIQNTYFIYGTLILNKQGPLSRQVYLSPFPEFVQQNIPPVPVWLWKLDPFSWHVPIYTYILGPPHFRGVEPTLFYKYRCHTLLAGLF